MITFSNQILHENLPSEEYFKLPGFSHSFVKYQQNGIVPYKELTDKMRLGSMVDHILTEPNLIDWHDPFFQRARKIAIELQENYKSVVGSFKSQQSYSGTMFYQGFELNVCGRLDWELPRYAVVDLKCTSAKTDKEFRALIGHMGYKNQLFNYAGLAQVPKAYILPYSITANRCLSIVEVTVGGNNIFWQDAILKFGRISE